MKYLLFFIIGTQSLCLGEGLKLDKTVASGFVANHWDVLNINVDYSKDELSILLALYKDKAAKDAGNKPIRLKRLERLSIPVGFDKSKILTELKKLEEFKDAIDD